MLIDMCLPKFKICQGAVAPNCFKSHTNSSCPDIFSRQSLPDVQFEIPFVQRNMVFTGQSVLALKKSY